MAINKFYPRDKAAFGLLANCGCITKSELADCKLKDKRIKDYIKNGYMKECYDTKTDTYYFKIQRAGREVARDFFGHEYIYNPTSLKHDSQLVEAYKNASDEERENWKNESELRAELNSAISEGRVELDDNYTISVPDYAYGGVCYEIITNNYGETEINEKQNFCEVMNYGFKIQ